MTNEGNMAGTVELNLTMKENILDRLDRIAEDNDVNRCGAINLLLDKFHDQTSGHGEAECSYLMSGDDKDYLFGLAKRNGLSPDEAFNKALDRERKRENKKESSQNGSGKTVVFTDDGFQTKEMPFQHVEPHDEKMGTLINVREKVSYENAMLLSVLAENYGIIPDVALECIVSMFMSDTSGFDRTEYISVKISAENADYLRKKAVFGTSWNHVMRGCLEDDYLSAVDKADALGLPLTSGEKVLFNEFHIGSKYGDEVTFEPSKIRELEHVAVKLSKDTDTLLTKIVEVYKTTKSGAVNRILNLYRKELAGHGGKTFTFFVLPVAADYLYRHAAWSGITQDDAINKAIHTRLNRETSGSFGEKEEFGVLYDIRGEDDETERIVPLQDALNKYLSDFPKDSVELNLEITKDNGGLLVFMAKYYRMTPDEVIEKACDMYGTYYLNFQDAGDGRYKKKVQVKITPRNAEFLRRRALQGKPWQESIEDAIESAHMFAVIYAKNDGVPSTENEQAFEKNCWRY